MKHYTLILTSIFLILCGRVSAQYDNLIIKLDIKQVEREHSLIKLKLYYIENEQTKEQGYKYVVKTYDNKRKPMVDTVFYVSKMMFDKIAKQALSISSAKLLEGMHIEEPTYWPYATDCTLALNVLGEDIVYHIQHPTYNVEKRNLMEYNQVCLELLTLAGLPKKSLK